MADYVFLGQVAIFVAIFGGAIALRLWLKFEPSPWNPTPTAEEERWLSELAALQLEARHVYC